MYYINLYMYVCVYILYTFIYIYTHTHTHTHIHVYIYICIYIYRKRVLTHFFVGVLTFVSNFYHQTEARQELVAHTLVGSSLRSHTLAVKDHYQA